MKSDATSKPLRVSVWTVPNQWLLQKLKAGCRFIADLFGRWRENKGEEIQLIYDKVHAESERCANNPTINEGDQSQYKQITNKASYQASLEILKKVLIQKGAKEPAPVPVPLPVSPPIEAQGIGEGLSSIHPTVKQPVARNPEKFEGEPSPSRAVTSGADKQKIGEPRHLEPPLEAVLGAVPGPESKTDTTDTGSTKDAPTEVDISPPREFSVPRPAMLPIEEQVPTPLALDKDKEATAEALEKELSAILSQKIEDIEVFRTFPHIKEYLTHRVAEIYSNRTTTPRRFIVDAKSFLGDWGRLQELAGKLKALQDRFSQLETQYQGTAKSKLEVLQGLFYQNGLHNLIEAVGEYEHEIDLSERLCQEVKKQREAVQKLQADARSSKKESALTEIETLLRELEQGKKETSDIERGLDSIVVFRGVYEDTSKDLEKRLKSVLYGLLALQEQRDVLKGYVEKYRQLAGKAKQENVLREVLNQISAFRKSYAKTLFQATALKELSSTLNEAEEVLRRKIAEIEQDQKPKEERKDGDSSDRREFSTDDEPGMKEEQPALDEQVPKMTEIPDGKQEEEEKSPVESPLPRAATPPREEPQQAQVDTSPTPDTATEDVVKQFATDWEQEYNDILQNRFTEENLQALREKIEPYLEEGGELAEELRPIGAPLLAKLEIAQEVLTKRSAIEQFWHRWAQGEHVSREPLPEPMPPRERLEQAGLGQLPDTHTSLRECIAAFAVLSEFRHTRTAKSQTTLVAKPGETPYGGNACAVSIDRTSSQVRVSTVNKWPSIEDTDAPLAETLRKITATITDNRKAFSSEKLSELTDVLQALKTAYTAYPLVAAAAEASIKALSPPSILPQAEPTHVLDSSMTKGRSKPKGRQQGDFRGRMKRVEGKSRPLEAEHEAADEARAAAKTAEPRMSQQPAGTAAAKRPINPLALAAAAGRQGLKRQGPPAVVASGPPPPSSAFLKFIKRLTAESFDNNDTLRTINAQMIDLGLENLTKALEAVCKDPSIPLIVIVRLLIQAVWLSKRREFTLGTLPYETQQKLQREFWEKSSLNSGTTWINFLENISKTRQQKEISKVTGYLQSKIDSREKTDQPTYRNILRLLQPPPASKR